MQLHLYTILFGLGKPSKINSNKINYTSISLNSPLRKQWEKRFLNLNCCRTPFTRMLLVNDSILYCFFFWGGGGCLHNNFYTTIKSFNELFFFAWATISLTWRRYLIKVDKRHSSKSKNMFTHFSGTMIEMKWHFIFN